MQSRTTAKLHTRHLPELDVIRAVAFLWVFVFHAIQLPGLRIPVPLHLSSEVLLKIGAVAVWQAGRFGVDLFFTLSAFLITSLLLAEHERRGRIDLGQFYVRRILRIWPLYFSVAAAAFAAVWILDEARLKPLLWPYLLMVPNWGWAVIGSPALKYPLSAIFVFWSLGIEEQFYLFWPAFLRWVSVENTRKAAWGMLACSIATRAVLAPLDLRHPWIYANTLARLDPIAMGILLSTEWAALQESSALPSLRSRFHRSGLSLGLGVACFLGAGVISSLLGLKNCRSSTSGIPWWRWAAT